MVHADSQQERGLPLNHCFYDERQVLIISPGLEISCSAACRLIYRPQVEPGEQLCPDREEGRGTHSTLERLDSARSQRLYNARKCRRAHD